MKNLLILDAGHNEYVAGKRSPDGTLLEFAFNHNVQCILDKRAKEHNFDVFLTNPEPYKKDEIGLSKRCSLANNHWSKLGKPNALFISIHANAYGSGWTDAHGTETWIYEQCGSKSRSAAKLINDQMVSDLGTKNRLVKTGNMYVTKNTNMPACLVEVEFYSNKKQVELLKNRQNDIAESILKGACKHFGVTYVPPKTTNPPINPPVENNTPFVKGDYNKPVIVTSSELNVRLGRGTEFDVVGKLSKGFVTEVWYIAPASNGKLWGSIGYKGNTRFISMDCVEPTNQKPVPEEPQLKPIAEGDYNAPLKVTADSLRVRKGRGTEHSVIGSLKKDQVISAWTIAKGSDGKLWTSFRYDANNIGFCSCEFLIPCKA